MPYFIHILPLKHIFISLTTNLSQHNLKNHNFLKKVSHIFYPPIFLLNKIRSSESSYHPKEETKTKTKDRISTLKQETDSEDEDEDDEDEENDEEVYSTIGFEPEKIDDLLVRQREER
jgi:hypothetical protein